MEPLGILLYGYDEETAKKLAAELGCVFEEDIILMSAGGRDEMTVSKILELGPAENTFAHSENKICMFLGFDEGQLRTAMKEFPAGVPRPIFCGLTEQNYNWEMKYLVEHLLEEKAYWESKKATL